MNKKPSSNPIDLSHRKKLLWIYLAIVIMSAIITASMGYTYYKGNHVVRVNNQLINATKEIKLNSTTAHLWFEYNTPRI